MYKETPAKTCSSLCKAVCLPDLYARHHSSSSFGMAMISHFFSVHIVVRIMVRNYYLYMIDKKVAYFLPLVVSAYIRSRVGLNMHASSGKKNTMIKHM